MIQRYINKLVNKEVFKHLPAKVKGKFVNDSRAVNVYTVYLNNTKSTTDLDIFLQALCYNTDRNNRQWNQQAKYLYFYNKVNGKLIPTLTDSLQKKIYNNVRTNPIYMERIYDILADYHILFDDNGNQLPLNRYPLIYYVGAYLETFTTIYLSTELTTKDINQLVLMASGFNILINQPDYIKLVKLRGNNGRRSLLEQSEKGKNKTNLDKDIEVLKFDKSHSGIVNLIFSLASSNVDINEEYIEKIYTKLNIQ